LDKTAADSGEGDNHVSLYEVLEVSPRASPEMIQTAHNLLKETHLPETERGKQVLQAGEVLLDEQSRKDYDERINNLEGKVIGQYRVIELIAEGGHAATYLGENLMIGESVCIKHPHEYSSVDEKILIEETKAIWDLRHYSIPTMRDIVRLPDGSPMLVMSYIPGLTLEKVVNKSGPLDPEHVAWIAERCLNALMYLHYNGVVHGDVKPQNIIIQPDTHTVVLVDYGLSIIRPDAKTNAKGHTPYFSSPEQVRGETPIPESDFYGLGMTMIYLLGGQVDKKSVPASTPKSLQKLIKRFIRRDPLSRPKWPVYDGSGNQLDGEDLCDTIKGIRIKDFGQRRSGLKEIPGLE